MTEYKIAFIGFGGVNHGLATLIAERNAAWSKELGFRLKIVGIADLFLGSIVDPEGLDAEIIANTPRSKGAFGTLPGGSSETQNEAVIRDSGADIVSEATFTNAENGEPATSFCRMALENGKHVVTTNKGPVSFHARELKSLAEKNHLHFEYEGAVMSGTPVIRMAKESLSGATIDGFEGILNGTCNFVLGCMENGMGLDEAVRKAQKLGYAEADPTADLEGDDVRLKVAILANELLDGDIQVSDVACVGIADLSGEDVRKALESDAHWKLIGSAQREVDGTIHAQVRPILLKNDHPLASISGATNAVTFQTDLLGQFTVCGPGAGRIETAFALLSDIIAIHRSVARG